MLPGLYVPYPQRSGIARRASPALPRCFLTLLERAATPEVGWGVFGVNAAALRPRLDSGVCDPELIWFSLELTVK
jgi:hypothetical protein